MTSLEEWFFFPKLWGSGRNHQENGWQLETSEQNTLTNPREENRPDKSNCCYVDCAMNSPQIKAQKPNWQTNKSGRTFVLQKNLPYASSK
jgi:hypothetical protein